MSSLSVPGSLVIRKCMSSQCRGRSLAFVWLPFVFLLAYSYSSWKSNGLLGRSLAGVTLLVVGLVLVSMVWVVGILMIGPAPSCIVPVRGTPP